MVCTFACRLLFSLNFSLRIPLQQPSLEAKIMPCLKQFRNMPFLAASSPVGPSAPLHDVDSIFHTQTRAVQFFSHPFAVGDRKDADDATLVSIEDFETTSMDFRR
jgi:hypothetical protein